MEDFWAACSDEHEVRRWEYSCLTLAQIKAFRIKSPPDSFINDDEDVIDPSYDAVAFTPLPRIDWTKRDEFSLDGKNQPIIERSISWYDRELSKLQSIPDHVSGSQKLPIRGGLHSTKVSSRSTSLPSIIHNKQERSGCQNPLRQVTCHEEKDLKIPTPKKEES
ncbi:hypothetical protein KI387_016495, partial [Taxus chinensis]